MSVESLITQHIDIWTSAVQTKSTSGRGTSSKLDLYGIKKLRELILELAVRGKLVSQDPNDEDASVLLKRISAKKNELIDSGLIKKPKKLSKISEEEIPFEIPQNWVWTRIQNVGHDLGQKKPDTKFTYIDVGAINKELGLIEEPNILEAADAPSRARKLVKKGTVIYSTVRPYLLNIAVIDHEILPEPIASTAFAIIHPLDGVLGSYIYRYLRSPSFITYVESVQNGVAYPAINDKQFFNGLIPIPPEKEQHRIVAKVDELMQLCDQLEQQTEASIAAHQVLVKTLLATLTNSKNAEELMENWQRISAHFDTLFTTEESIDQLKQTILQLAVMGKLVPQNPADEPASELLKRIAKEKAQLVKDKKIKKQKALPPIIDDEKPFELPDGWEWERIGNLSNFIEYGSSQKTVDSLPNGVPVLKMGDIQNGKLILGQHKVMSSDVEELPNLYLKNNDVLYNRTNSAELVGKTGIFKGEDDIYSFASYLIRIRCNPQNMLPDYLNLSMNTPMFRETQINPHIKKQCGQANVNGTLMKAMLVSLPPLEEQHRIFNKLGELMMLCDQLKNRLFMVQEARLQFADALVEQVV
ncbi:restriction endonuclease subunit S [Vibrio sp. CAIM 722]|uniref:Restriction endonuclease subunit S n=1 Tax=Vibrio eleionomae TaxID=2653505 RepID=A0A7X4LML9_9VIBR|nr:restriction endonuclease subunit S [Vibrio eleionomae]MZI94724.1 restriction endonuclease subunit S [Vibrio eleionomae]